MRGCRAVKMGAAFALLLWSAPGCSNDGAFQCAETTDCDAGRCEATGFCSFPDAGCASGHRYGELAGSLSSQCVPVEESTTQPGSGSSDGSGDTTVGTTSELPGTSTRTTGVTTDPTDPTESSTGQPLTTTAVETTTSTTSMDDTSGTTGTESETGPPLGCTAADFSSLPGAPLWFSFSSNGGSVGVSADTLVLDVPAGSGGALAGLRTAETGNYALSRVTATIASVPAASVVTTNLTLGTSTGAESYAVVFRDGIVRVELFESPEFTVLGSADTDVLGWPLTVEVRTEGGQVTALVEGSAQTEVLAQDDMPAWFADVHASLNAGNPMPVDPMGTIVADHFEICPPL